MALQVVRLLFEFLRELAGILLGHDRELPAALAPKARDA
jgi:hypothetical protein